MGRSKKPSYSFGEATHTDFVELLLTQSLSFFYRAMTDDKWKEKLDMQDACNSGCALLRFGWNRFVVCSTQQIVWEVGKPYLSLVIFHVSNTTFVWL